MVPLIVQDNTQTTFAFSNYLLLAVLYALCYDDPKTHDDPWMINSFVQRNTFISSRFIASAGAQYMGSILGMVGIGKMKPSRIH